MLGISWQFAPIFTESLISPAMKRVEANSKQHEMMQCDKWPHSGLR